MINAWPLQRQLQLFMLHLLTINKMPQRPRHRSNPSQASVVRGQRPGKGPLEVEGSQSRTRLICGYRPADGCLEKRGVGEGEEEIEQKQDKLQTHTSLFFYSFHSCMWWLIMTLAVLVGGETQLGKCQWITNDVSVWADAAELNGNKLQWCLCVCPLPGAGKILLLTLFSWIRDTYVCPATKITHPFD